MAEPSRAPRRGRAEQRTGRHRDRSLHGRVAPPEADPRLREARGFSQEQLAQAIGSSQRMIAYYESHAERAPAHHLTTLAQVLRVSVDPLVGYQPVQVPTGRANPRLWRKLRQVEALPPPDRKQVLQLIDTLVERETLKKRAIRSSSGGSG